MASASFSSDERSVAFLKQVKNVSSLVVADERGNCRVVSNPEEKGDTDSNLTLEEKLRRERTRQTSQGITSFVWLPNSTNVVFPRGGSLMQLDTAEGASPDALLLVDKSATGGSGSVLDPKPSPDGSHLAFVQQDELYVLRLSGGQPPVRVTYGAREAGPGMHHGLPDFIIDEEFDRHSGYWWSPCGSYVAFQETDERHVPAFRIQHVETGKPSAEETHAYPFAGASNAHVRIGIVDVKAALANPTSSAPTAITWLQTGEDKDVYVARCDWMPLGMGPCASRPAIALCILNRAQTALDVVAFDTSNGRGSLLVREVAPPAIGTWVNMLGSATFMSPEAWPASSFPAHASLHAAALGGFLLWASERTGFAQVYAYGMPKEQGVYSAAVAYAGPPKSAAAQCLPLHRTFARFTSTDAAMSSDDMSKDGMGVAMCLGCITGRATSRYMVEGICGVACIPGSPAAGPALYFTGTLDSPLERHLYCVPVFRPDPHGDTEERASPYGIPGIRRLTSGAGIHTIVMSGCANGAPATDPAPVLIVDSCSSMLGPPSLALLRFDPAQRFAAVPVPMPGNLTPNRLSVGHGPVDASVSSPSTGRVRGAVTAGDALLIPFVEDRDGVAHLSIAEQVVTFDSTGNYGGRMSAGVALLGVLSGALPVGTSGTPYGHEERVRLVGAAAKALQGREEGQFGHEDGPMAIPSVSGLFAAARGVVQKGMNAVDTFGEKLSQQLQEGGKGSWAAAADNLGSKLSMAMARGVAPLMSGVDASDETPQVSGPSHSGFGSTSSADSSGDREWLASDPADIKAAIESAKANPAPLVFRLPASDGYTPLFGALWLPDPVKFGKGPWPCLVSVYGGPHVQRVKADWTLASEARAQAMVREGFMVLAVDNRGSARRGLAFEGELHKRMGSVEVDDQARAVQIVIAAGLADPCRVGVYGWSYGGYMSCLCLAKHPTIFHAAVAGAPVVFWEGYDTGYTERYMGTPSNNAEGYESASVLTHVKGITGRLLLIHGLLDENVHVRHSWGLVAALQAACVPHDTLFIPGERHVVRSPAAKAYLDTRLKEHFLRFIGADKCAPQPVQRIPLPSPSSSITSTLPPSDASAAVGSSASG